MKLNIFEGIVKNKIVEQIQSTFTVPCEKSEIVSLLLQ